MIWAKSNGRRRVLRHDLKTEKKENWWKFMRQKLIITIVKNREENIGEISEINSFLLILLFFDLDYILIFLRRRILSNKK